MAQRTKKRTRKRRNPGSAPRAVVSTRRDERAERVATARRARRQLGREGERPESPFAGLPVSEFAILVGGIALVIGFFNGGGPAVIVGVVLCGLGVVEVTAREHFSGYRSHTLLLAAIPAVALEAVVAAIFGVPKQHLELLIVVVPVFAVLFWLLRKKFQAARQTRVARPPAPPTAQP